MRKSRSDHKRSLRAISPLIATLILIAIAIVGGVVVYRLFFSSSGAISQNLHGVIADVSLAATGAFSMALKNDGSIPITGANVTLTGPAYLVDDEDCGGPLTVQIVTVPVGGLGPGKTVAQVCTETSATLIAGDVYTVTATLGGAGDQSYVTSVNVLVSP